ncbi:MAG TPA: 23S rRNA (adenine(2030)-N(6))-methyltransferase RlmJ [Rhodanobacteraceae bacterium]|nr:23S rRNA (adenine(2030)-N(6))-methyltransferase RlmJ [Rhodanobacteraceae bacterium]
MNYRHAFHAGNFADVFKHAVLLALLDALTAKDKPLCYLDTHAGRGRYALDDAQADKTGEWREGIGRVFAAAPSLPAPLHDYARAIHAFNPDGRLRVYPGSPALAARALRERDRLLLCETQEEEAAGLREVFRADLRAHVHNRDGYAAMNALLPPPEKRGLVLVDPPFEAQAEEFRVIENALAAAHARWPTGVYAVWYPIKRRALVMPFQRWLGSRGWRDVLLAELLVRPDDSPLRLNGAGFAIINTPWQFEAKLATMLPALKSVLAQAPGASHRLQVLA